MGRSSSSSQSNQVDQRLVVDGGSAGASVSGTGNKVSVRMTDGRALAVLEQAQKLQSSDFRVLVDAQKQLASAIESQGEGATQSRVIMLGALLAVAVVGYEYVKRKKA